MIGNNSFGEPAPVFNSVADIMQFGNMVVGAFEQVDAGMFPQSLHNSLTQLTQYLAEGMGEAYKRLTNADDNPLNQAECELFMDMQRRYMDKIPLYAELAEQYTIDDF